jgi:hypothetical protein
VDVQKP